MVDGLAELKERLRRLRAERRLSMSGLERRAGLGHTTVSRALNGTTVPSEATVVALARALGVDADPLLALRRTSLTPTEQLAPGRRSTVGEDGQFEERYRQYVKQRHGNLSIVGLDLSHPNRATWPLDTAYLSLDFAISVPGLAKAAGLSSGSVMEVRTDRADHALAGKHRVLVRGLAGGGKTTLLQWLACGTAAGKLPTGLSHLHDCVPFMLPLRSIVRHVRLPSPQHFLESVGCPLRDSQPQGWADRVLNEGRGLLLIDGLDEVPQMQRALTQAWLRELLAAYPQAKYVLTTRPSAVAEGWLAADDFAEITVRPMGAKDVAVFISRWHAAAVATTDTEHERAHLSSLEAALRDAVRFQRDLARLTTTPLLCALVCALNRDRRGHLPHGRMELYEAALSMLMVRRDRERDVEAPEGLALTEHQSIQLLQRLAYWLIRNGQTEMDYETALAIIDDALPAMPQIASQSDAAGVIRHLIARSGLLRTPAADVIDFVHRTFQDYLGAKAAIEVRDIPLLVRHAHDDQWEDVLQMAVAHARPHERVSLLRRLISRGDRTPKYRARLHLLAMACLQHAPEIDPGVRRDVEERATALVPPRSDEEAEALMAVGPVILGLLPGPEGLDSDEAAAVIRTAELIGGDAALTVMKRFRDTPEAWALANAWDNFNAHDYAREVLAHLSRDVGLAIKSREQLGELAGLNFSRLAFRGDFTSDEVAEACGTQDLLTLHIDSNPLLEDLDFISAHRNIARFGLHNCQGVADLTPLSGLPSLAALEIENCTRVDVDGLVSLAGLNELSLDVEILHRTLESLPIRANITKLTLGRDACKTLSLEGVTRWPSLAYLGLWDRIDAFSRIVDLSMLEDLALIGNASISMLAELPSIPQVRELFLGLLRDEDDLALVCRKLPNLQRLTLWCSRRTTPVDLTPLSGMKDLSITLHEAPGVLGVERLPAGSVTRSPRPRE
ncbi:NACHT domain-containing protein [Streptomyces sp. NBC_00481]|uniref:NACHT domain-containing protein n=1 Tax=unclassified Streptomyces TaxID=2593676 RepID=UPI002DD9E957|nr:MULTISPECIES: NACHT domain-containing protein [unclassified Streptomyces]WRY97817.1 NACHT domain-containing protein [Streptomyces sp. NBC_00481]